MESKEQNKAPEKEEGGIGRWLYKQVVGTGIITAISAAGGAVYGAIKKYNIKNSTSAGAALGLVSSLGLGGMAYDAVVPLFSKKSEKQKPEEEQSIKTEKYQVDTENPDARTDHFERLNAQRKNAEVAQARSV